MQDLRSNSNERTHRTHIGAHSLSSLTHGESVDVCAVWWMRRIQEKRKNLRVANVCRKGDMQSVFEREERGTEIESVNMIRCVNAGVCGIEYALKYESKEEREKRERKETENRFMERE